MQDKKIRFKSASGTAMQGTVALVYQEAVASGTNEYTAYTMLSVRNEHGDIIPVYPRDVTWVEPEQMVVVQVSEIGKTISVRSLEGEKIDQVEFEEWAAKKGFRWMVGRELWYEVMTGYLTEDQLKEEYKKFKESKAV